MADNFNTLDHGLSATDVRSARVGHLAQRATALPPASGASQDLFTIDGGQVFLTGFLGYVTVAMPNEVLSFDLDFDPDDGLADRVLATAQSVQAVAAATFIRLNTTTGGALVLHASSVAVSVMLAVPILFDPGDIRLDVTGGGVVGTTARVRWDAWWVPVDAAATLTAVAAP